MTLSALLVVSISLGAVLAGVGIFVAGVAFVVLVLTDIRNR